MSPKTLKNLAEEEEGYSYSDALGTKPRIYLRKDCWFRGKLWKHLKEEEAYLTIESNNKGSNEGSGIILEVPEEPKDNSGSSSSSLSRSDDEVQDVSSDEEN
nr:hypothetical protein [Tanacetum cinerariifolium]